MQGKSNDQTYLSGSIFWVSLGLSAIFWVVDSILTVFSTNSSFLPTLIGIETRGFWQRLIVLCFLFIFASHVQYSTKKRREAEEQLQQTLESLKKAVGTTIQVLVSALESRDPYTTGHQSRSADLARAIATEMRLDQDKIDGIYMAGIVHDIGKIAIPAEILIKPTKLTNIEFSLIKQHSQSGYEMLKNVESSWPLAEIVHQHHERMDGSGYPRNLKGDEILMEARILSVADVVEAMASHRPYRAALGIEAALKEIEKNKGILYDETVSDVCLKLLHGKDYKFALQ
jgi:HD-GYP domain-containing protein (c-di-GMP phosphodiesterase class II)